MVMTVNMHEAKTNFSRLAKLVEAGEQVLVARDGKVIMKLTPVDPAGLTTPRDFSVLDGKIGPISDEEWANYKAQVAESFTDKDWS
jgi:antitoxin (DNA-binding transcriptional repressor) of toxin-antitoxin stability system